MMVKICGITDEEDALAAAAAGADAVGFNFYRGSPRFLAPELAARIARVVPPGVWKVGVFVNATEEEIRAVRERVELDVIQLHGDETPEQAPRGVRVWKALRISGPLDAQALSRYEVEAFLVDSYEPGRYGGTGRTQSWRPLPELGKPMILAGGLDPDNVREAIRAARPWGVDACSRLEIRPGKKDHDKMIRFIRNARLEQDP